LHFSGYTANHAQNIATQHMITLNYAWLPLLLYIVMFIVLIFYNERQLQDAIDI